MFSLEGGDESGKSAPPGANEQFADFPDASQVFRAVLYAEPEVRIQTMTDIVPVEYISPATIMVEHFLYRMCECGFTRS